MATTRTPGITVIADGRRFIDKRYLGVRIGLRVGAVTQDQAEERLRKELARVQGDVARKAHACPTFMDCAARYIEQSQRKRSIDIIKWHVSLLQSYIDNLEPQQVHDQTLEPFIQARLAAGASATTINRMPSPGRSSKRNAGSIPSECSLPRKAHWKDEQQRLAAGTVRGGPNAGSSARRRRIRRRSGSAARRRQSFDGGSLRECTRRPSAQPSESHTRPERNADRATCGRRSLETDCRSPTATRRIWFCAPSA